MQNNTPPLSGENDTQSAMPKSLGIIMDGNRRWAKEQNMNTLEGHGAGLEKIKEVLEWSQDAGIKEIIFYAFSTENWKRTEEEVGHMMGLIEFAFTKWIDEIISRDVRVRILGEKSRFSESIQEKIKIVEEKTKKRAERYCSNRAFIWGTHRNNFCNKFLA